MSIGTGTKAFRVQIEILVTENPCDEAANFSSR
jgi:hypothetical protein